MNKKWKIFLAAILVSMPFWLMINIFQENLENFLLAKELQKNPSKLFLAQISSSYPKVTLTDTSEEVAIQQVVGAEDSCPLLAKAALSVKVNDQGLENIFFEKMTGQPMAIASLTKLMTGLIVSENYLLEQKIKISKNAVDQPEDFGNLREGETLTIRDLLKIMLIESSNDAVYAMIEQIREDLFVQKMNLKAIEIGMEKTYFFNATGLDSDVLASSTNYSTADDLKELVKYLLFNKQEILQITSVKEYPLYFEDGSFHHVLKNTNQLLGRMPTIIGGKTGQTDQAGGCLIIVLRDEEPGAYIINIILNSPNRFKEMEELIRCAKEKK